MPPETTDKTKTEDLANKVLAETSKTKKPAAKKPAAKKPKAVKVLTCSVCGADIPLTRSRSRVTHDCPKCHHRNTGVSKA